VIDIAVIYKGKIGKLKEWRTRYSKDEYPYKVILNMFYDLFATQHIWPEINQSFSGRKKYSDFSGAFNEIKDLRRNAQIEYVNPRLEELLNTNEVAAGVKYSDFSELVSNAKNGDNQSVVEIEYTYWFYCSFNDVTVYWAACGLMGLDKHSAYLETTGGDIGGLKLDTFKDAIGFFPRVLSINSNGFVDADGNDINPMTTQGAKYYPRDFELLQPLW
tara:strand:- start:652 stop:1302 length:651 start_codon:yes stop_codon:yes gene_type:complete